MNIKQNLESIQERIVRACESVNRNPEEITLIAVSKKQPIEKIQEIYDLGIKNFGENRLQEAIGKIESLPKDITWHYVGRLQTNKIKKIVKLFNFIHSVDSKKQLLEIEKHNEVVKIFIELNLLKQPQKSGISPEELDEFVRFAAQFNCIEPIGLMAMGPLDQNMENIRPYFKQLNELLRRTRVGNCLSMGMSNDFEVAIQEGATHIRVGSAIFGPRT